MTTQVCWQYLVKEEKRARARHEAPMFFPTEAEVRQIPYQVARNFIIEFEWLGNMGTSKYCYGLFLGDHLASVVCYGPPVAPSRYAALLGGETASRLLQLCRGASTFWTPSWGPSKLIARSLRALHRELGTEVVIAYADPQAGEIGTVYQACGAHYLGMTSPGGGKRYIILGHSYDPRKVHKKFGSRAREHLLKIDPHYFTQPIHPKHRYIFLMGGRNRREEAMSRIAHLKKPYPKRSRRGAGSLETRLIACEC